MGNAGIEPAISAVRGEEHAKPRQRQTNCALLSSAAADKTARHYLCTRGHERYSDFSTSQALCYVIVARPAIGSARPRGGEQDVE